MTMLRIGLKLVLLIIATTVAGSASRAQELKLVPTDELQPLRESVQRLLGNLDDVDPAQSKKLSAQFTRALQGENLPSRACLSVQQVLDNACLLEVAINPESRVKVSPGPASRALSDGEWKWFLVKVHNQARVTAPLRVSSPQAPREGPSGQASQDSRDQWLQIEMTETDAKRAELTGALLEYRLIQLKANQSGFRSAVIAMDVGQGTADIGFRNDTLMTFRCSPTQK